VAVVHGLGGAQVVGYYGVAAIADELGRGYKGIFFKYPRGYLTLGDVPVLAFLFRKIFAVILFPLVQGRVAFPYPAGYSGVEEFLDAAAQGIVLKGDQAAPVVRLRKPIPVP
jgi:hypothetical protein